MSQIVDQLTRIFLVPGSAWEPVGGDEREVLKRGQ